MQKNEKSQNFFSMLEQSLKNENFIALCERRKNENPFFEQDLMIAEKIAMINIQGYSTRDNLIYLTQPFTKPECEMGVLSFFEMMDRLAPNGINFTQTVLDNNQYFRYQIGRGPRPYCCSRILKDGSEFKEIFCLFEGRVGDISNAIHEFTHSLSKTFLLCKGRKDFRISELATVITDHLSNFHLKNVFPSLSENFNENSIFQLLMLVAKARETLIEGLLMKVALGEETLENIEQKYPQLFNSKLMEKELSNIQTSIKTLENPDYKLEKNESHFAFMFESKYLIPTIAATNILERFKTEPEVVASQLKNLVEHDHEWTLEQGLENFSLPNKFDLVDNFVNNFHNNMQLLISSQNISQS